MFVYRTNGDNARGAPGLNGHESDVLARAGATDGSPLILSADGSYDVQLNRFLRELPSWGARSPHTVSAYARDLALFGRFLCEQRGGLSIWQAGQDDLQAYHRARRQTEGFQVSASTWNRFLAALDKWAAWAVHEGLIPAEPFRMAKKTAMTPRGLMTVRTNALREAGEDAGPVRFLPYEDYLLWRDVGLGGQLPSGRPDPAWRGRHGERNVLFADLLVCTGMRLTEASSLLVTEIPPLRDRGAGEVRLAATITKRRRGRKVFVTRRVLRDLHHYIGIERDELVQRKLRGGAYAEAANWTPVKSAGLTALTLAATGTGLLQPYARIEIAERRMLRRLDGTQPGEPLWLWLGEDGQPLARSTWQAVFRRANERCAGFGLEMDVHPHTLRHTFAVHMLGLLLRQTVRAIRLQQGETLMSQQVKRMMIGDPLRRLQLLLGHRNRETVFIYLDVLDEAQEIVLAALRDWDEQAEVLSRIEAGELSA